MKTACCILLLTAAPGLASAQAVASNQRLHVVGSAPGACLMSSPAAAAGVNASFSGAGSSGEIRLTQLVDPDNAQARAASIQLSFPVVCNTAHQLVIRTVRGGLLRDGAAPAAAGFRDRLDYSVRAEWAGRAVSGGSESSTLVDINSNNGGAGLMSLSIDIPGGGDPLVAGAYSDSIVVEFRSAS